MCLVVLKIKCDVEAINEFKKPYLSGMHISEGTSLQVEKKFLISKISLILFLGVMLSCISPENLKITLMKLKA